MSEAFILRVIFGLPTEIKQDPTESDTFRQLPIVGNRRIRHLANSHRNPIPRNPTTSDRILSEVVGFLSDYVESYRIRRDPNLGLLVLGTLNIEIFVFSGKFSAFYSDCCLSVLKSHSNSHGCSVNFNKSSNRSLKSSTSLLPSLHPWRHRETPSIYQDKVKLEIYIYSRGNENSGQFLITLKFLGDFYIPLRIFRQFLITLKIFSSNIYKF